MGERQRLHFIGVTTGGSRIMDLFPVWADVLGLDAEIVGRDVEIGAPPERHREVVREIAEEQSSRGALVTTHKVSVLEHAHDLFAEFDAHAELLREVSCISKRREDDALVGHAKDPITAGQALEAMIGQHHWAAHPGAETLCMGAGGAGTAIVVRLLSGEPPPARIVATDKAPERLRALDGIVDRLRSEGVASPEVETRLVADPVDHDRLVRGLPPASLVVNATGMGKDVPGSPITGDAVFPTSGVVWELNYRGSRPFLEHAHVQADARDLRIHDGWRYFLHGWSEVIAEVFRLDLTDTRFAELAEAARPFRPG